MSSMYVVWNKEKDLEKAVRVNQVVSVLQLNYHRFRLRTSNCAALANIVVVWPIPGEYYLFVPPANIKNLWFSDSSKMYEELNWPQLTSF